jgi:hypothetical protein
VGTARLFCTEWRVVTYLSLEGANNNVDAIRKYIDSTVAFCIRHSNSWQPNPTVCNSVLDTVKKEYDKVQEMRWLVLQLTRTERGSHRQKRCIFSLVGHKAHSLLGMLDSDSEAFYNKNFSIRGGAIELAEVDPRTDYCCSVHSEIRKSDPTYCVNNM